jgi:cytochrome c oxidase accessory protein FixG
VGDCIDCGLCVQVCPTGIDIRDGLQYECIGCAACIDVCDGVMDKMNYPRGLIRYDTERGMAEHAPRATLWKRVFRPRVLVYTAILGLICTALLVALLLRTPFKVDVVRDRGALARVVEDGWVENVYRVQVMNATERTQSYTVAVQGLDGVQLDRREPIVLAPAEARWVALAVRVPPEVAAQAGSGAHAVQFQVSLAAQDGGSAHRVVEKSTFLVPR